MMDRMITLENDFVLLRPLTWQDFSLLQPLASEPDMWVYFTHDLSIPEEFEKWAEPHFQEERLQFTIVEKSTGKVAGATAFGNYSVRDQRVEIGWTWLGKAFQGTGINQSMKKN